MTCFDETDMANRRLFVQLNKDIYTAVNMRMLCQGENVCKVLMGEYIYGIKVNHDIQGHAFTGTIGKHHFPW